MTSVRTTIVYLFAYDIKNNTITVHATDIAIWLLHKQKWLSQWKRICS